LPLQGLTEVVKIRRLTESEPLNRLR